MIESILTEVKLHCASQSLGYLTALIKGFLAGYLNPFRLFNWGNFHELSSYFT